MSINNETLTPAQVTFREKLLVQLTDKDALGILDVSVGHIFDLLCDEVEYEEFEENIRGFVINITIGSEPDSVIINCGDYEFEFDDALTLPIIDYVYFSDENVKQLAIVNVVAAMLDGLQILLAANGTNAQELKEPWDG